MTKDDKQAFRLDIFKLQRDQLSVAISPLDVDGADPYATTFSGEVLTSILKEHFGLDNRRLCELGMDLAAHGRAALTLRCTRNKLRTARLLTAS